MSNYTLNDVLSLCKEIRMPQEIVSEIPKVWSSLEIDAIVPHTYALVNKETDEQGFNTLKELFGDSDPKGLKMLLSQLYAALHTRVAYAQKGIGEGVYIDTIKCFTRFANEYLASFGHYGFDLGWWGYRQLSMRLFRLGVLEFEISKDNDMPTLSVHIPSDSVMTNEALARSYSLAKSFFARQNVAYADMFCGTWLLNPILKEILPPESKILNFQKDYEIVELLPDAKSFMKFVFKKEYTDINQLPETTHLQREIKKILLAGGNIGNAKGRYIGQ